MVFSQFGWMNESNDAQFAPNGISRTLPTPIVLIRLTKRLETGATASNTSQRCTSDGARRHAQSGHGREGCFVEAKRNQVTVFDLVVEEQIGGEAVGQARVMSGIRSTRGR